MRRISIFIVLFSHLGLVLIDFFRWETFSPKRALAVNTYICKPPVEELERVGKSTEKKGVRMSCKAPPPAPPSSKIAQKPTSSVSKGAAQKTLSLTIQKRRRILEELAGALSELELGRETITLSPLLSPPSVDALHIDHVEAKQGEGESYFALLTAALKKVLELPELGMVKLELTLLATGQVWAVRILEAESERNASYLKRQLMVSQLSPFTEELQGQKKRAFVLTFCNEN